MDEACLPEYLQEKYLLLKNDIQSRLREFAEVPESAYFYEMCYCLCTAQSKAQNAFKVQKILEEKDFFNNPFNPASILRAPLHYIRFHNQKANRLLQARELWQETFDIITSNNSTLVKRWELFRQVNGLGMKESSHFLRNIGNRNLAILDRHILRHLIGCGIFHEVPEIYTPRKYIAVENSFLQFANAINIPLDELDLLFWSNEAGMILK